MIGVIIGSLGMSIGVFVLATLFSDASSRSKELRRLYRKYPEEMPTVRRRGKKVKESKPKPEPSNPSSAAMTMQDWQKILNKAATAKPSTVGAPTALTRPTLPPLRKGPSIPGYAVTDGYQRMLEVYGPNFIGPAENPVTGAQEQAVVAPGEAVDPFADEEWDAVVEDADEEVVVETDPEWDETVDAIYNAPEKPKEEEVLDSTFKMVETNKLVEKALGLGHPLIRYVRQYYLVEVVNRQNTGTNAFIAPTTFSVPESGGTANINSETGVLTYLDYKLGIRITFDVANNSYSTVHVPSGNPTVAPTYGTL